LAECISNNAAKSRSNRRTEATFVHIKNDTRIIVIVQLDISINYLVVKSEGETVFEGFNHSSDVEGESTEGPSLIVQAHQVAVSPRPPNTIRESESM
jgi:hypothetical protein